MFHLPSGIGVYPANARAPRAKLEPKSFQAVASSYESISSTFVGFASESLALPFAVGKKAIMDMHKRVRKVVQAEGGLFIDELFVGRLLVSLRLSFQASWR